MDGIVNPLQELAYRSKFINEMGILWKTQFLKRMSRLSKPKAIDLRIGDWVIIPSTFNKRTDWKTAKIVDIVIGSDEIVRTVQVDYNNKQFWRPANGLIKLTRGEEKL